MRRRLTVSWGEVGLFAVCTIAAVIWTFKGEPGIALYWLVPPVGVLVAIVAGSIGR